MIQPAVETEVELCAAIDVRACSTVDRTNIQYNALTVQPMFLITQRFPILANLLP
jgi:hypothetical protein